MATNPSVGIDEDEDVTVQESHPKGSRIIPVQRGFEPGLNTLMSMSPQQANQLIAGIENAAHIRRRLIQACAKLVEPDDFIAFGNKYYLMGAGAQRVQSYLGIVTEAPIVETRVVGDDVFVDVLMEVWWPMTGYRSVEIGTCNTRDRFFAGKEGSDAKTKLREYMELTGNDKQKAVQMLLGDVRKKATENARSRCVSGALGIRGLSAKRLTEMGFDLSGVTSVNFKTGTAEAARQGEQTPQQAQSNGDSTRFVPFSDLSKLAVGSVVSTTAILINAKGRRVTVKGEEKDVTDYQAADPEGKTGEIFRASKFGLQPDWYAEGVIADMKVEVREYRGKRELGIKSMDQSKDMPF